MSETTVFFRHCPGCGRRFEIRLVGKVLVEERKKTENVRKATLAAEAGMGGFGGVVLQQDVPVTVDSKDFRYTYRCKHCGHEWSEVRTSTKGS